MNLIQWALRRPMGMLIELMRACSRQLSGAAALHAVGQPRPGCQYFATYVLPMEMREERD
jgi:hypothetical protein